MKKLFAFLKPKANKPDIPKAEIPPPRRLYPLFGNLMKPIHPFDLYTLLNDKPLLRIVTIGETGIPVMSPDGRCFLSYAPILEIDGQLYLQTTTVNPSPDCPLNLALRRIATRQPA